MSPALRSSRNPSSSSSTRHGAAARRSRKALGSPQSSRGPRPAAAHTDGVGPLGPDRRAPLEAHLELPPIAEVVLVQEPFIGAKVQVGQLDLPCVVAGKAVAARHSVVLLADAEAMEVEVGPSKADLQDKVQLGQGAVGPEEKAPPEHRVNLPDPDVDEVSFGLGILFHGDVSLSACQRLGSF
jgi:hypothetical protein